MCLIIERLHNYVPKMDVTETTDLPDRRVKINKIQVMWEMLLGGDQLTAAQIRGAQAIRCNSHDALSRLEGVHAVIEYWHTLMSLLKV